MNIKIILSIVVVAGFIVFGSMAFMESNLEYTDVEGAMRAHKKVQLKGEWARDHESNFDAAKAQFTFYLKDEKGKECKVVLEGAAPNNFDLATSVVAKGRFTDEGYFHATEVLTKCPSKYEAQADEVRKSS